MPNPLRRSAFVAVIVAATLAASACQVIMVDTFDRSNGLVTNEVAYWSPSTPGVRTSPTWEMTSGSLFTRGGVAWTGPIDDRTPNATSSNGTNSAIFRLVTRKKTYRNVNVRMALRHERFGSTPSTPPAAWDGAHVFLRYRSETSLYYASINRRDGAVVVKKKVPGGPSGGGTYYTLGQVKRSPAVAGRWVSYETSVRDQADGSVRITVSIGGRQVLSAVDRGTGGPVISRGGVGLRGDNAEMSFDHVVIDDLDR